MNVTEGGMRMPSVPPAQIDPVATSSGKPRRRISGMPILPMAAQQAGDEPVSAAKIAQAPRFERTSPPGSRYSQRSSASYRSLPAGDEPIAAPIITNIGIDTSVNSSSPDQNVSATTRNPSAPWKMVRNSTEIAPSPNATGTPEKSSSSVH